MTATPSHLNIGCGPHRAPAPWWNLDVIHAPELDPPIVPDQVVTESLVVTFGAESVERIYLGHVIEHVAWDRLPDFLRDVYDVLAPGGEVMVVGPDVLRAIIRHQAGVEPMSLVLSTLEDATFPADGWEWDGARHQWNAHEARVVGALSRFGGFETVEPVGMESHRLDAWPVVSRVKWQCAVWARKAS